MIQDYMETNKEYFAFISYQRNDEEWADRLRSEFEHYRLSSSIRKQNASLPKEIRPIFRDVRELAGGVLAKWYYKDIGTGSCTVNGSTIVETRKT